jgi:cullin 3
VRPLPVYGSQAVGDSFRFGAEIRPTVLTTGFWPIQSVPPCTLVPQLMSSCEHFRAFYLGRHTGRRLTWQTSLGTADLKTLYTPRPYELTVTTYQMCILLMFNDKDDISFRCGGLRLTRRLLLHTAL